MRDDDEIPRHLYTPPSTSAAATDPAAYDDEAPECIGTCLHRTRSHLQEQTQTPMELCRDLKRYCESQALQDFCTLAGVNDVKFTWNPHIPLDGNKRRRSFLHVPTVFKRHAAASKLYEQFWKSYQEEPSLNLALAFHGTGESNVPTILKQGLDPKYRRTQAFGAGEYFAKDPGLSATYGQTIMIYLLLMPKDVERVFSQKDRDIIVVKEQAHQLPLGYISFDSVNEHMIQHSQQMRLESRNLKLQAIAVQAQIKAAQKAHLPTEKLEFKAEQAWKAYLRMKMDAKRNHLQVQVGLVLEDQHVKNQLMDSHHHHHHNDADASLTVAQ